MGCICIHYSLFTFSNLELHYSKDCKCFYCIILKVGMHDGLLEELVKFSFLAWIMVTQVWSLCVYSLSCSITTCVLFCTNVIPELKRKRKFQAMTQCQGLCMSSSCERSSSRNFIKIYSIFLTPSHINNQYYFRKHNMNILCCCAFVKNSVLITRRYSR